MLVGKRVTPSSSLEQSHTTRTKAPCTYHHAPLMIQAAQLFAKHPTSLEQQQSTLCNAANPRLESSFILPLQQRLRRYRIPKFRHTTTRSLSLCHSISLLERRRSAEEKPPTMDSAVRRMSSFAFLPFLAVLFAANCAVGFIAPSVHVAPSRPVSPSAWQGVRHATCRSRCRVRSESGLRWRGQAAGLSMVDPHVLRLQAAELGSRLKVGCCVSATSAS